MSTISASTTTTTAYKVTADTTGVLAFQTGSTPTTYMTLDASGNLGVGTTSPSAKLDVAGQIRGVDRYYFKRASDNYSLSFVARWDGSTGSPLTGTAGIYTVLGSEEASSGVIFAPSNTERARIDSSGNLLVGTTTSTSGGATCKEVVYISNFATTAGISVQGGTNNAGTFFQTVNYAGTINGSITQTNASTIAYNTTSDYRLKENIAPMTGALAKVAALNPVTYTWKLDGAEGQGFIAHELQAVIPDAVTGEKDAVNEDGSIKPQSIDTSFLVATLTAAIQELTARIEALENK